MGPRIMGNLDQYPHDKMFIVDCDFGALNPNLHRGSGCLQVGTLKLD